ncbi:MAG: hypothetical protein JG777_194 [Clostridia bacterium]|uniref:hypothetical protein n=1 Tax=Petroclostridium xylanilyticum TaxID=1792311 RepID=UPI000B993399|nr:hypothetical protein [Petroclostridium xylanilyticum]MBZ4644705.1 hypothetical protein [Clostridia bacterium]
MKKREKDAIINRLLFVTAFSILASIVLWFIFNGYMHTSYILAMPKIMIAICIIGVVVTAVLGWKIYTNRSLLNNLLPYIIFSLIVSLSSIAIYFYVIYAIYVLWILIAAYLVVTFAYNLYKINAK